jgi:hypothetical protein
MAKQSSSRKQKAARRAHRKAKERRKQARFHCDGDGGGCDHPARVAVRSICHACAARGVRTPCFAMRYCRDCLAALTPPGYETVTVAVNDPLANSPCARRWRFGPPLQASPGALS